MISAPTQISEKQQNCSTVSHLKLYFCVGAAFGSPQVTNIKTVARTAKGGPYNVKFKLIQSTTILRLCVGMTIGRPLISS